MLDTPLLATPVLIPQSFKHC